MHRSAGLEDGAQQIARNGGVKIRATFGEGSEADFPLHYDESAGANLGEVADGQQNFLRVLAAFQLADSEEGLAAQPREGAAQLGLKHYDERDGGVGGEGGEKGAENLQLCPDGGEIDQAENADAEEYVYGAASADDHQELVDEDGDYEDVESGR